MERKCIFSICTYNRIPFFKILAESIDRMCNKEIDVFLILVERKVKCCIPNNLLNNINLLYIEDIFQNGLMELSFKFSVFEFCFNLKPSGFLHLFKIGYTQVIYFDSDICLYDSIDFIFNKLMDKDVILTPHFINMNFDFKNEEAMYRVGIFNLGFAAFKLSDQSIKVLNWWKNRCESYGFHSHPKYAVYGDQKFLDALTTYIADDLLIEKHDGCNVAYWNAHERLIEKEQNKYFVNGYPLVFYHFSGLARCDHSNLSLSSVYVKSMCVDNKLLLEIYCEYISKALEFDYAMCLKECSYNFFDNGLRVSESHRKIFSEWSKLLGGKHDFDPFNSKSAFFAYLSRNKLLFP